MRYCEKCKEQMKTWVMVDGVNRNLCNRRFCLTCSPFGEHNTKDLTGEGSKNNKENETVRCSWHCCEKLRTGGTKFCGKKCENKFYVDRKRRAIKLKAIEYKGGKCEKCGYSACPDALHFHHIDPTEKDFAISTSGHCRSWERVKNEIDKCMLICANCHAEIHNSLRLMVSELN